MTEEQKLQEALDAFDYDRVMALEVNDSTELPHGYILQHHEVIHMDSYDEGEDKDELDSQICILNPDLEEIMVVLFDHENKNVVLVEIYE